MSAGGLDCMTTPMSHLRQRECIGLPVAAPAHAYPQSDRCNRVRNCPLTTSPTKWVNRRNKKPVFERRKFVPEKEDLNERRSGR